MTSGDCLKTAPPSTRRSLRLLRSAVREALLRGRPVVVWQDGQVVELPADQIPAVDSALKLETRSITT